MELRIAREKESFFEILRLQQKGRLKLAPKEAVFKEWSVIQKSLFVESLILGLNTQKIYLAENVSGVRYSFDGYNRIKSLMDFYSGDLKLQNLEFLKDYEGLTFSDIKPIEQAKLEDTEFDFVIIQPPTSKEVVHNFLTRINENFIDKDTFLKEFK